MRPIGFAPSADAISSGWAPMVAANEADFAAGQMTLAVMPQSAHSRAAVRVAARRASLLVLYSAVPMWALTPLSEQMLTMRP